MHSIQSYWESLPSSINVYNRVQLENSFRQIFPMGLTKDESNSHHTERAFLRCESSCARRGLVSDWRPCYTLNTGMVFPVTQWQEREQKWVSAEHKLLMEHNSALDGGSSFVTILMSWSHSTEQWLLKGRPKAGKPAACHLPLSHSLRN